MLDALQSAVRAVGGKILECREQGKLAGVWQGTQFKAQADLIADECMRKGLLAVESLPVVSEEDSDSHGDVRPHRYWLIDPIDGTASFVHGFDGFVTQAALVERGEVRMAAVYAPALNRMYAAKRGYGATVNGRAIAVRAANDAIVLVDNYPEPRGVAARLFRDLPCRRYIESGSIGLKICLVADGTADLFVKDVAIRDWDVAAPSLILSEAGGELTQYDGSEFPLTGSFEKIGTIAAANRALIEQVKRHRLQSESRV